MPTYEYECDKCGHKFEVQRSIRELDKELKCPKCGDEHPRRDFSALSSCSIDTLWSSRGGG